MALYLAPKLPLNKDKKIDYVHISEYKELVKQNLKILMFTVPGERIMDLNFGIGLRRFLFEMDNPTLYNRITSRIHQQLNRYLPYIEIVKIDFNSGQTPDSGLPATLLQIRLEYYIKPLETVDVLEITLPGN